MVNSMLVYSVLNLYFYGYCGRNSLQPGDRLMSTGMREQHLTAAKKCQVS